MYGFFGGSSPQSVINTGFTGKSSVSVFTYIIFLICLYSARVNSITTNLFHTVHITLSPNNLSENGMFSVQPRCGHCCYIKLTSICVRTSVGHCQKSRCSMIDIQNFVIKIISINTDRSFTVARYNISTCV